MFRTPRRVLLVAVLVGVASSGCTKQTMPLLGLGLELAANIAVAAATQPSSPRPDPQSEEESAGFGTPVNAPVERAMSECELERGRWREAHQAEEDPPPELWCRDDGSYPQIAKRTATPPGTFVAPVEAGQMPEAPANAPKPAAATPETL